MEPTLLWRGKGSVLSGGVPSRLLHSLTKQVISGIREKSSSRDIQPFATSEGVKILQLPERHTGIPTLREELRSLYRSAPLSANTHLHPTGCRH